MCIEKIEILEDEAKIFISEMTDFIGCHGTDILAVDEYIAACTFIDRRNVVDECGLTGTRWSHDTDKFPFVYFEVDIVQCFKFVWCLIVVDFLHIACFQHDFLFFHFRILLIFYC